MASPQEQQPPPPEVKHFHHAQALPPPAGRTLWNSDMIACLLELRLALLLPQFAAAGGAPGALKGAWKTLQLKFAIATNVNLSMLQLKNKYQQLKREYQLTTQLLEERVKREAKRNDRSGSDGGGSGDEGDSENEEGKEYGDELDGSEEIVLPQYWHLVQKAFDDVDGNDLHKSSGIFTPTFPRIKRAAGSRDGSESPPPPPPVKKAKRTTASGEESETLLTSTDRNTTSTSQPDSRRNSVEPEQPPRENNVSTPLQRRAVDERRAQTPRDAHETTSPPAITNSNAQHFHRREPPAFQREAPRYFARPLAPQSTSPVYYSASTAQQTRSMSNQDARSFSSSSTSAANSQKPDTLAQALVTVGNTIASAMIESAKILAGAGAGAVRVATPASSGPTIASGSTAVAALAAKIDTQLENQVRMLAMLKNSYEVNEALLDQLRKKDSDDNSTSSD